MWLFSDLHALEVELWIHCFCTRRTPFKSSDCYQANLCPIWRFSVRTCFLATTFQMYSLLRPRKIINVETWLNAVWNLDWIWVLEIVCTSVSGYRRVALEPRASVESFCPGLFLTACVCSGHQTILRNQSVKQISSGYFHGVLHHFVFSWVILYCFWCSDPDLGHF